MAMIVADWRRVAAQCKLSRWVPSFSIICYYESMNITASNNSHGNNGSTLNEILRTLVITKIVYSSLNKQFEITSYIRRVI